VREYGETREAFARRVKDWAPSLEFLSHEAERVKLSGTDPDPPNTHKVRAALGNVVREVSNARPWWRRLLGALHPASWLDVK
jgi:hypothetical protein